MATKQAIIPDSLKTIADAYKYSPGILVGNQLFIGGILGNHPDLSYPTDAEEYFVQLFENIKAVLDGANATFSDIVSITTFYSNEKFAEEGVYQIFDKVRLRYVTDPYPSWVGVGVNFVTPEAYCEFSGIAIVGD